MFLCVYYMVVEIVFKRGGANQPYVLFLLCGLIPFKFVSQSISQSVTILPNTASVIKSISFPKAVLPLSTVFTNLVYFVFGMIIIIIAAVFYGSSHSTWPNLNYVHLISIIVVMIMLVIGLSLIVSVVAVFFNDLRNILSHVIKAWYFASQGLYSFDRLPDSILPYARLNPLAGIMNGFREVIMWNHHPYNVDFMYASIVGFVLLSIGYYFFRRMETRLVKHI